MRLVLIMAFPARKPVVTAFEPNRDDIQVRVVMFAPRLIVKHSAKNLDVVNDAHGQRTFAVMVISFDFGG